MTCWSVASRLMRPLKMLVATAEPEMSRYDDDELIAAAKMQITGANIKVDQKEHIADMTIGVMIKNAEDLEDLVKKIKSIHGVIDVRR